MLQGMGRMKRATARENEERMRDRFASTEAIAAAIIVAVRLAREPDFAKPSPRLMFTITESIKVAREIVRRVAGA